MSGSLYEHALALHREFPDEPLPRDGYPFPDEDRHRATSRRLRKRGYSQRKIGVDVASALDDHFSAKKSSPARLAKTLAGLDVPIHRNDHIAAAALRARRSEVRRTGRWLVRHSDNRRAAAVGLALLAADYDERDSPLIQTIGLLSNHFGPLAADALARRQGGIEALTWLGDRISGWGRVYVVETLCKSSLAREWLLRRACDGDFLNAYFAAQVATASHLLLAISADDAAEEIVDHTGQLLGILTWCEGMGSDLWHYPPAAALVEAYTRQVTRLPPTDVRLHHRTQLAEALQKVPLAGLDTSAVVSALLG
ncbi:hypothetical protein OG205_08705 [Lentzea sp. NBC_00516]|uniref:hypothetical protein n=1 Tax=Lentzea sp. NBC_00516 TaxID=2903582 RepID=UPI002E81E3C0|nr:hypothetical protein [Lentzea sp. NBC_00516]WUD27058.1 hypothetical protein OG205_08705 [Lentzea sp. NBC_00516]